MNVEEIKQAVRDGKNVYWASKSYEVIRDRIGQFLIICKHNQYIVGLTHQDGVTLNGKEEDFFVEEYPSVVESDKTCGRAYAWMVQNHYLRDISLFATREQAENYVRAKVSEMRCSIGSAPDFDKYGPQHFFTIFTAEVDSEIHRVKNRLWYEKHPVPERVELLITTQGDASVGIRPDSVTAVCHTAGYDDPVLVADAKKLIGAAVAELFGDKVTVQTMREIARDADAQGG
jgi:hypothetical protein